MSTAALIRVSIRQRSSNAVTQQADMCPAEGGKSAGGEEDLPIGSSTLAFASM